MYICYKKNSIKYCNLNEVALEVCSLFLYLQQSDGSHLLGPWALLPESCLLMNWYTVIGTEGSLLTQEEVQCTLDKNFFYHTHTPTHTCNTHAPPHPPKSAHSLCGLCISELLAGRPQEHPSSALTGCTEGCMFPEQLEQIWEVVVTQKITHMLRSFPYSTRHIR